MGRRPRQSPPACVAAGRQNPKAIALNGPDERGTHGIDGRRERLTEHLHRLGIENDVPGASVAVLAGGEVVEATFGVVSTRSGVPVTSDTLFMIQSITKIITATMAMQLVDDGLVGLDDSVRRQLPEFRTSSCYERVVV